MHAIEMMLSAVVKWQGVEPKHAQVYIGSWMQAMVMYSMFKLYMHN